MTNILLKGSALGALAVALGFSAIPASAAPAVDFDAPMVAIDTGVSAQAAELAQDRDQYRRGRSERSERRQVLRERAAAPDAAVAPARAQRAQEARRAETQQRAQRPDRSGQGDSRDGNVFRRANEALREQARADAARRDVRQDARDQRSSSGSNWRERREDARERQQDWRERQQDRREDWRERRQDRREDARDRQQDRRDAYRDQRNWRDQRDQSRYRDQRSWDQSRYRDQRQAYRNGYGRYYDGRRWNDYRVWNRSDWRRNQRYDWHRYRAANRSLFNIGRYYSPYRNHRYSRISIGFTLGSGFYSNRYYINDPWRYRLPEVYGPYRWVRYYDDVLLVDIYSGEVVDVIYDFFW